MCQSYCLVQLAGLVSFCTELLVSVLKITCSVLCHVTAAKGTFFSTLESVHSICHAVLVICYRTAKWRPSDVSCADSVAVFTQVDVKEKKKAMNLMKLFFSFIAFSFLKSFLSVQTVACFISVTRTRLAKPVCHHTLHSCFSVSRIYNISLIKFCACLWWGFS